LDILTILILFLLSRQRNFTTFFTTFVAPTFQKLPG